MMKGVPGNRTGHHLAGPLEVDAVVAAKTGVDSNVTARKPSANALFEYVLTIITPFEEGRFDPRRTNVLLNLHSIRTDQCLFYEFFMQAE